MHLHALPQEVVGHRLNSIFTNVNPGTPAFHHLHKSMIGHWPQRTDETGPYDPEDIFDEAVQALNREPTRAGRDEVVDSLIDLAQQQVVAGKAQDAVNAACSVWPKWEKVSEAIKKLGSPPSVNATAELANRTPWDTNDNDKMKALKGVWEEVGALYRTEQRVTVAERLLEENPIEQEGSSDAALNAWLDVMPAVDEILLRLVKQSEKQNKAQCKRIGEQIAHRVANLSVDFFCATLPEFGRQSRWSDVLRRMQQVAEEVNALCNSEKERSQLGRSLLRTLVATNSVEMKNQYAEWIKQLDAEAVLKEIDNTEGVTDDDRDALGRVFKNSRYL